MKDDIDFFDITNTNISLNITQKRKYGKSTSSFTNVWDEMVPFKIQTSELVFYLNDL